MTPVRMRRLESGVRTVIAFIEAFNHRDLAGMLLLISEECVFEAPSGTIFKGKNAIAQYWQDFLARSPDAHFKIEETIGFGLRCLALWRCEWTDSAGANVQLRGADLFRLQNGLITVHLSYIKG